MLEAVANFMSAKREKQLGIKYTKMDAILFVTSLSFEIIIGVIGLFSKELAVIIVAAIVPISIMFCVVINAAWRRISELQK